MMTAASQNICLFGAARSLADWLFCRPPAPSLDTFTRVGVKTRFFWGQRRVDDSMTSKIRRACLRIPIPRG